ncbi:hypothetical protein A6R68_04750 [Neotoma lepida]|uniref:Uncharacterized protein n=1 Tax=Neotoma lepida TaxID=56216 RepID=A0A1A6GLV7_NEOLE|nr:hypothetical protein A6R68_04750 [Neotoma lepida]
MCAMRNLLHHTADLRCLRLELYPVPQESCDYSGTLYMELMSAYCDELMGMLKAIREPGRVFFGTDRCHWCDNRYIYNKTTMSTPYNNKELGERSRKDSGQSIENGFKPKRPCACLRINICGRNMSAGCHYHTCLPPQLCEIAGF